MNKSSSNIIKTVKWQHVLIITLLCRIAYSNSLNNAYLHDDRAIEDFSKSIELNPEYSEAYKNSGIAYGKKGVTNKSMFYLNKALTDLSRAIELDPKSKSNYSIRSLIYSSMGKEELARKDAEKAR